jgi:cell shape-determining protein MreD
VIRDKKLAVGMVAAFFMGILWGVAVGDPPGETFLRGAVAVACAVVTYPLWRQRS